MTLGAWLVVACGMMIALGCGGSAPQPPATTSSPDTKSDVQSAPPNQDAASEPTGAEPTGAEPTGDERAATELAGNEPPTPADVIPPNKSMVSDSQENGIEPRTRLGPQPKVRDLLPPEAPQAPTMHAAGAEPPDPVAEDQPLAYRVDERTASDQDSPAFNATDSQEGTEAEDLQTVTVFYGTDRREESAAKHSDGTAIEAWGLAGMGGAVALVSFLRSGRSRYRRGLRLLTCISLGVAVLGAGAALLSAWFAADTQLATGIRYGNERGELQLGTCQVSIPWTHEVGQVERPTLLRLEVREDVRKHVVLHETNQLDPSDFFTQLRKQVQAAPRPEVFVFVHGYNVTFAGAARRTAQIAHDVEFAGAPIFFSWPSQGGLLKYTVDETNVDWAVPHLKQFLLDVSRLSGATHVNLIAHSMGNRALTEALREIHLQLQSQATLFNQVILAAPDIDAEIFRRDLAPALVQTAQRVTLYASSRDQALVASKKVHGYPRAGDSGGELVVLDGIETVDVSQLDTSLLGHSYYGSSNPILLDMRQLIERALPAAQREWLLPRAYGELTYWIFEERSARAIGEAKPL
jgi:esterase/lipase superfamily enzyme